MPRIIPKESPDKRPVASWSSGKEVIGTDRTFRGFFLDTGLDAALDAAADAAGWPSGKLSHLDGVTRTHWLLPSPCSLYVLIGGVPYTSVGALARTDISYSGIGCRWNGKSKLGVQCLHPDLLAQGYTDPIPFVVSSTSSDDLLAALLAHNAVLDACERAAAAKGRPRSFEFWEVALVMAPGARVPRGSGDKTTTISPIVCAHPASPDVTYLRGLLAPAQVAEIVAARWHEIEVWAAEFARPEREHITR